MVRFEKGKIVVEVATQFPADDWLRYVQDIVYAIGAIDKDRVDNDHDCINGLCDLLMEMLPDETDVCELLRAKGIK